MLFQVVLVVLRCCRLVKVVRKCFYVASGCSWLFLGCFYADSICLRCFYVVLGGVLVVLGCCSLF